MIMEEIVLIEINSLRVSAHFLEKNLLGNCLLIVLTYTQIKIHFNSQDDNFEWTVGWKDN